MRTAVIGIVFCCFNNNYKIVPAVQRLDDCSPQSGSVLWLIEQSTAPVNLRREAESAASTAPGWCSLRLPLEEHLARHRLADLFVDALQRPPTARMRCGPGCRC